MFTIRIQTQDFDLSQECATMRTRHRNIGAIASFVGIVRDHHAGDALSSMTLEHYPGMTEKSLGNIVKKAIALWPIIDATVIHRIGQLQPTAQIVLVAVAAPHRGEAFQACEYIMDYLKTDAPFWKKETTMGGSRWVDARSSDNLAKQRWTTPPAPLT